MVISEKERGPEKQAQEPEIGRIHDFGDFSLALLQAKKYPNYIPYTPQLSGVGNILRRYRLHKKGDGTTTMPQTATIAIGFETLSEKERLQLGVLSDSAGLYFTGQEKDRMADRIKNQLSYLGSYSQEDIADFQEAMKEIKGIFLMNRSRMTWSARHILAHGRLYSKYDGRGGELRERWGKMREDDRARIESWYRGYWGVRGEVDHAEVLKEYLIEEEIAGTTPPSVLLTPIQSPLGSRTPQRITGPVFRLGQAYTSLEIVKEKLSGLKHWEATDKEKEKLLQNGYLITDSEGNSRVHVSESGLNESNLSYVSSVTGMSVVRLQQLIEREQSKDYLADSSKDFSPFHLSSARYTTLGDIVADKTNHLRLIGQFKDAIVDENKQKMVESVNGLIANGYREFPGGVRLTYDGANVTNVKVSKGDINIMSQYFEDEMGELSKDLDLFKGLNPDLDPGMLIFIRSSSLDDDRLRARDEYNRVGTQPSAGVYIQAHNFMERSHLSDTGLIAIRPPWTTHDLLSTREHEYKHFIHASYVPEFSSFITEINSFMVDVKAGELTWEEVKATLTENERGYLGAVTSDIRKKLNDPANQENRPEYERLEKECETAAGQLRRSVDVVARMQKNGLPDDTITAILMYARKYDDILSWESVPDEDLQRFAHGIGKSG
ncbi:MAG: hypothetical protein V1744_02330 [Candidatus Altiarchaeota archaeon]